MLRFLGPLAAVALAALSVAPTLAADNHAAAARAEHQRIVNYWTSERVAAAKPRDFVRTAQGFKPAARPGGGSGSGSVTGASYTGGGPVTQSVGKVFFSMAGGNWQCSGSVASDGNRSGSTSIVLTAGHCAVDETTGEFATNWVFIPAWDEQPASFSTACTASKYGCWTATSLVAHHSFANAGGFNEQATRYDFAFAVVGAGGKSSTQLDAQFTPFDVATTSVSAGATMAAFGFPAGGKYHGNDLTWCSGPIFNDASNNNFTWGMACDMTGGSSGGGWLASFSNGSGVLRSLNSYGYSGVKNMYGPKFNNDTQNVYNTAKSAPARNTLV